MPKPNLAIIVGSNRRESINRKLAEAIAKLASDHFNVSFPRIDNLPLFNQDLETQLPPEVARLKNDIARADAVLFVTPEHNRSIPAVLKNAIDWGGRPYGQNSWAGKVTMVTGTSPGASATALAQQHLRFILNSFLGALVLPGEAYIQFKPGLIDTNGNLANDSTRKFLQGFVDQLASLTRHLAQEPQRSAA